MYLTGTFIPQILSHQVIPEIARNPATLSFKYRSKQGSATSSRSIALRDGDTCVHVAGLAWHHHD
jgi:G:T-mismatch repair DNA endonuclease (very short patch repair protein)